MQTDAGREGARACCWCRNRLCLAFSFPAQSNILMWFFFLLLFITAVFSVSLYYSCMWGCLCITRLSVTLPLRVMIETQTQQKLKGIKVFSYCSRTGLLRLPFCKNTLKLNRQKLKKKVYIYLKTETVCVCCFCGLLLHLCNVNKMQMSSFLSLSNEFMPDLIAIAPATAVAALRWAGVFINSGLAAVTEPLLHHSSVLALCCTHQLTSTVLCTWGAAVTLTHVAN